MSDTLNSKFEGMQNKRVLFFYPKLFTFIQIDKEILEKYFEVKSFAFEPGKKIYTPIAFIKQMFFLLRHIRKADVIVCDFAGYLSFLPTLFGKLFGKPSLMILCGTECYSFPSIGYGSFNKKLLGLFTRWSYRLATHLAPVHKSMVISDYTYDNADYPKQGYRYFCSFAKQPYTELNYGFNANRFYYTGIKRMHNSFLTVVSNTEGSTFFRKGLDLIITVAKIFPDFTFTIIGKGRKLEQINKPANIQLLPWIPNDELKDYYSSHEFYFQLSMIEGFPNTLGEAMLCGCIPIGSDAASIPEIIGDAGFTLKKRDTSQLENLIKEAVQSNKIELSKQATQRIKEHWPSEKRETLLKSIVESLSK